METTAYNEGQIFEVPPEVAISMILGSPVLYRQPAPEQYTGRHELSRGRSTASSPRDTHQNP